MGWNCMNEVLELSLNNRADFNSFKDHVKAACDELNIALDDEVFILLQLIQNKMNVILTELETSNNPKMERRLISDLNSYRNQACTIIQKRYIEIEH